MNEPAAKRKARPALAAWAACAVAVGIVIAAFAASNARGGSTPGHEARVTQEQKELLTSLRQEGFLLDEAEGGEGGGAEGGAEAHGDRDLGTGPTFTQVQTLPDDELLALFPEGSMTAADMPEFRAEILRLREFVAGIDSAEAAQAAGFFKATNDVPFMGEHWINGEYLSDGVFDPGKPEGLLFSTVDGVHQVVGVWFLQLPGMGAITKEDEPQGFVGAFDEWHAHVGLCVVGTEDAREGFTEEACTARGGDFTGDLRWMLHVWVAPEAAENSRSVVAYLNAELNQKQRASRAAAAP